MKNSIAYLILVPLVLSLLGCWNSNASVRIPSETQSAASPSSTAATEKPVSSAQASRIIPTAFSLEEYEQYLDRFVELSPDFIHYDMLKEYGEFLNFRDITYVYWENYIVHRDGRIQGDTDEYVYNILDPNGYTIVISITPAAKCAERIASPHPLSNTQALHTATKENGRYKYNDLYYSFYHGHLTTILLQYKESIISFHRPDYAPFSEYPVETNSFIAKLLNTETAETAVAEFLNRVATAQTKAAD